MKLITLNIWGGQVYEPLTGFIKEQSNFVDIFCFQEVFNKIVGKSIPLAEKYLPQARPKIYSEIQEILSGYKGYLAPAQDQFGLATFVRENINVIETGDFFVFKERDSWVLGTANTLGRNVQYVKFKINGKDFLIANLHGIWTGKGKDDTAERIIQSEKIRDFFKNQTGAKILCGDFNLWPYTKSMAILEKDMINLVKNYKITSTRSSLYTRFSDKKDRFADYILVSKDVRVKDFKVLPNEVSDHLPLFLEFS